MIELNSVVVILMIEAIVALVLGVIGYFIWTKRQQSGAVGVAHSLIDELGESKPLRTKKLGKLISESCELEPEVLASLMQEVDGRERALYQQIIQIFLNRDPKVLREIDDFIQDLSKPYCAVLKQAGDSAGSKAVLAENTQEIAKYKAKIRQLATQNAELTEQLRIALQTIDEVSNEYASIFNGSRSELELRNSCKKILQVFNKTESALLEHQQK